MRSGMADFKTADVYRAAKEYGVTISYCKPKTTEFDRYGCSTWKITYIERKGEGLKRQQNNFLKQEIEKFKEEVLEEVKTLLKTELQQTKPQEKTTADADLIISGRLEKTDKHFSTYYAIPEDQIYGKKLHEIIGELDVYRNEASQWTIIVKALRVHGIRFTITEKESTWKK